MLATYTVFIICKACFAIFNYIIGWTELGLNHREVITYFTGQVKQEELFKSISESSKIIGNPTPLVVVEKNDFKLKAYIIGIQNSETEQVFSNIKWENEKEYSPELGIKGVLEKFVSEDYDYALLCKQDFKISRRASTKNGSIIINRT